MFPLMTMYLTYHPVSCHHYRLLQRSTWRCKSQLYCSRHHEYSHAVIPRRPFMLRISLLAKCRTDSPILSALRCMYGEASRWSNQVASARQGRHTHSGQIPEHSITPPAGCSLSGRRTQRAPERLHHISTCMERSQSSRNSIGVTPSSCNRPIRPILSCIQSGLSITSPVQSMIVPRDASHPSCTNVDPKGECLWHARGAAFPVFKDSEPEVMASDVTIEECSLFIADELPAASQLPSGSPNAIIGPHPGSSVARSSLDQALPLLTILDAPA